MPETIYISPFGKLSIQTSSVGITSVCFTNEQLDDDRPNEGPDPLLDQCTTELDEYFSGSRKEFTVPLDAAGTDFQKQVWDELKKIPFGHATSYQKIASNLGDPNKIRAVGNANGKNPIAIIVPCHRVIGADGKLVGYAGGLDKKRQLLRFEGAIAKDLFD